MLKVKRTPVGLRDGGPLMVIMGAMVAMAAWGCDDTPTRATVSNGFPGPAQPGTAATFVYKAWWASTLFSTVVAPGETSEVERTIPATDYAYALIAPGWLPDSVTPPAQLIALRSAAALSVGKGDLLAIDVSDATFGGDCAAGQPLDPATSQFIVDRIFPGDFANATYDSATCALVRAPDDGGGTPGDAGLDAGTEAPASP